MRRLRLLLIGLVLGPLAAAQAPPGPRDLELRQRYELVLARSPFQEQAFERTYQLYAIYDGIEAWESALAQAQLEAESPVAALVVRARIAARRLDLERAAALLEQAREAGAEGVPFALLLGRIYHDTGRDEQAVSLLEESLGEARTQEERGRISRLLGNLLLRMGQREAAIAAWERVAEGMETDVFVLEELAILYEGQRMWPEAIEAWSRVVLQAEGDPYLRCRALRAMGDAERAQGDFRAASESYREALDWVAPGNWLFDALTRSLVETHAAMGDLQGLAESLEETLRTNPASTEYRVLLGDVYKRMQAFDAAKEAYREAIDRAPAQQAGYSALIALMEEHDDNAGLIEAYRSAIARFPGEPEYHRRLGEAYLRAGEREAALEVWRGALGAQPDAAAHVMLAQWLEGRGFREEARQAFADAVALNPRRSWRMRLAALEHETGHREAARARWMELAGDDAGPDDLLDVAEALEARGFPEEAERLLERALEAAPERMDILLAQATMLLALARYEDAETAYTHLLEHAPGDFHRMRGERGLLDVLEAQGRLSETRSEWERVVREDRTNVALRVRLAQICERMGDRGRALALYRESAEIEPDNAALLHRLARAYESAGNPNEAIATYRRMIELEPGRAGGYYRELVPVLAQQEREAEAVEAAHRVVEGAPTDPEAQVLLARVYERFDRGEPRLEALREAVRLAPDQPGYHEAYGRALLHAGAMIEARDAFRAMLDTARDAGVRLRAVQHLAETHARLDRIDELAQEFEARIHQSPRELEHYEMLAIVHRAAGAPGDALGVLERAAVVSDDRETALRRVLIEAHAAGYLDTVIRAYEELERLATVMDAREWEQLGRAYAQLGRMADASRAWERMLREHDHDATVLRAYIRVVQEHGLQDEVFAATGQLLALERHDYQTRLEFAQQLAGAGRVDEGMEQLRILINLGAGLTEGTVESGESPRPSQQPFQIPAHVITSAIQEPGQTELQAILGTRRGPGGGAYHSVRQQALHLLTQLAAREDRADELIAEYEALAARDPDLLAPYFDLLLVLGTLNRPEAMLALVKETAQRFESDREVVQLAARVLEAYEEYDDALAMYDRLHELESTNDTVRRTTRIRLLGAAGRTEAVHEEVRSLREAYPAHVGVLQQAADQLAVINDLEQAEELFRAAADVDERHRQVVLQKMAHHYRNRGLADDAARMYAELLFVPPLPDRANHPPPAGFPAPYLPQTRHAAVQTVDTMVRLLSQSPDWPRLEAFQQTMALPSEPAVIEEVLTKMRDVVWADTPDEVENQRMAYDFALLLAARAIEQGDTEGAFAWLPHLERLDATPETLANVRLIALERAGDYDGMRGVYGELAKSKPQEAGSYRLAQARLAVLEENWEAAESALTTIVHELGRQREIVGMIRQLHDAGEHERASRLLDSYLTDPNPLPDAYGLRILLRTAMGRHEEAMAFARESWEYTVTQQGMGRGGRLGQVRTVRDLQGSPMVQLLYSTFEAAGETRALLDYLEQWQEDAPNNGQIQLDLAHVYRTMNRHQQAMDIYRGLVERRPGDRNLRLAFAHILASDQRDQEAHAIYEEAFRANPGLFREHAWQARQVFDRLGKSRELFQVEERLALAGVDPRTMLQMAQEAENTGNMDLAALVYERLTRMAPGELSHRHRLAESQRRAGQLEASIATWQSYLQTLEGQPEQTSIEVAQAVPLFVHAGKRAELEALAGKRLADHPDDPLGIVLQAGLAQHDGDYREAFTLVSRLQERRPRDHALFGVLVSLARLDGHYEGAIELIAGRHPGLPHARWGDLAELYAAQGDTERAFEYWQMDATRHSGPHGLEQTMRRLVDHGLYAEAIAYFDQHAARVKPAQTVYDNFLQHALRAYLRGGGAAEEWVRGVLREVREEPAWVLAGLIQGNEGALERRRALMHWALEERPEDDNLVRVILQHAQQGWNDDAVLHLLEDAIAHRPGNVDAEAGYITVLLQRGEAGPAWDFVRKALEDEVTPARFELAFRVCDYASEHGRLIALRERHWSALDENDQQNLAAQWAQSFARAGDPHIGIEALRAQLESAPSQVRMDRYIDMLFRSTDGAAALEAFEEASGEGYYEREGHLHTPVLHLLAATHRLDDLMERIWRQASEGQAHLATASLQRVLNSLRTTGAAQAFIEEWTRRLESDAEYSLRVAMRAIDGAQRSQVGAWHEELLSLALERHPEHWDLLQRRAQSLQSAGRPGDAVALLEEALANAPATRRESIRAALLEAYASHGNEDKVERILLQSLHLLPLEYHEFGINSGVLTRAGRFDEAADSASRWAWSPVHRERAMSEQAVALAQAGKVDAALALYEAEPALGLGQTVLAAMLAHDRLDAALALVDTAAELGRNPHSVYVPLLTAMLVSKSRDECAAELPALRQRLREGASRGHFTNETVHAILRHREVDDLLPLLEAMDEPVLWAEGARNLALLALEQEASAGAALNPLARAIRSRPEAMLGAVDVLMQFEANGLARTLLEGMDGVDGFERAEAIALARLAMRAESPAARPLYAHAFALDPTLMLDAPDGAALIAMAERDAPLARWLQPAIEAAPFAEQVTLVKAAIALGRGDTQAGQAFLADIEALERLSGKGLEGMALWMAQHGHEEALISLCRRVAASAVQRDTRYQVLSTGIRAAAGIGDAPGAIDLLDALQWLGMAEPWALIEKSAASWPDHRRLEAIDHLASARARLAANPAACSLAYLELMLNGAGSAEIEPVADAWRLAPWQTDMLRLALHSPQSWWVSPREWAEFPGSLEATPAESVLASMTPDTPLSTLDGWKRRVRLADDPAGQPGAFTPLLTARIEQHGVYLATDVHSPDARTVRFTSSADDWHRVWVNGEEVFRDPHGGPVLALEDRYEADLREGVNRVVVWLGNAQGTAALSFGIVDNGPGVRFDTGAGLEGQVATR